MFQFLRWDNDATQIVMEGVSFYFASRIPIAFRENGRPLVIRDQIYAKKTVQFIEHLTASFLPHKGKFEKVKPQQFAIMLRAAYKKAMINGIQRLAVESMLKKQKTTENQNDTNQQFVPNE